MAKNYDQEVLDIDRVSRTTKGGEQMRFRATVVIGDRNGKVGYGVEKGKDVQIAISKAFDRAEKNMIEIPLVNDTIPHQVESDFKAAEVVIKPAPQGSGLMAGGALRIVLELAGVNNASAKILSRSRNKVTNVKAAFDALQSFLVEPGSEELRHREKEAQEA
ncbi:MAG: 30S ribosomal protein S5 [Parcubacteria group bacterium QH_9_35_7]|nr:MAG: 30S ribosomal protein S5 [Parcubacteria group bacterium QH_9_35_7]